MLEFDIFYLHTKFGDSRISRSRDMSAGIDVENRSCDLLYRSPPFRGDLSPTRLGFDTFYLCAKFDDSSINHS